MKQQTTEAATTVCLISIMHTEVSEALDEPLQAEPPHPHALLPWLPTQLSDAAFGCVACLHRLHSGSQNESFRRHTVKERMQGRLRGDEGFHLSCFGPLAQGPWACASCALCSERLLASELELCLCWMGHRCCCQEPCF